MSRFQSGHFWFDQVVALSINVPSRQNKAEHFHDTYRKQKSQITSADRWGPRSHILSLNQAADWCTTPGLTGNALETGLFDKQTGLTVPFVKFKDFTSTFCLHALGKSNMLQRSHVCSRIRQIKISLGVPPPAGNQWGGVKLTVTDARRRRRSASSLILCFALCFTWWMMDSLFLHSDYMSVCVVSLLIQAQRAPLPPSWGEVGSSSSDHTSQ